MGTLSRFGCGRDPARLPHAGNGASSHKGTLQAIPGHGTKYCCDESPPSLFSLVSIYGSVTRRVALVGLGIVSSPTLRSGFFRLLPALSGAQRVDR